MVRINIKDMVKLILDEKPIMMACLTLDEEPIIRAELHPGYTEKDLADFYAKIDVDSDIGTMTGNVWISENEWIESGWDYYNDEPEWCHRKAPKFNEVLEGLWRF